MDSPLVPGWYVARFRWRDAATLECVARVRGPLPTPAECCGWCTESLMMYALDGAPREFELPVLVEAGQPAPWGA